ncbi:hypothetical protein LTS18_011001 [Coniosporium uncinatum]|uniref:Uncharacterized protein n=1 Tax=Coniosporium uncinatum TaxID=93489 RepID=A0ACC3CYX5_9PEZI|nr:hypothetical protein LTS18_011001 [Coniosporium uncinatum]
MKYTAAAIPLLFASASYAATPSRVLDSRAPSLVERDVATITQVLASINVKVTSLDTAVQGFSSDISTVKSASDAVLVAIQDGVTQVKATTEITVTDALTVQSSVQELTITVKGVVGDLTSKKEAFVSAGEGGTVLAALQEQKSASEELASAITGKVPEALQSLAQQLSAGISESLQEGITAFEGTESSSSSSSSGGAGGAAASGGISASASASLSAPSSVTSADAGSDDMSGMDMSGSESSSSESSSESSSSYAAPAVETSASSSSSSDSSSSGSSGSAGSSDTGGMDMGGMSGMETATSAYTPAATGYSGVSSNSSAGGPEQFTGAAAKSNGVTGAVAVGVVAAVAAVFAL